MGRDTERRLMALEARTDDRSTFARIVTMPVDLGEPEEAWRAREVAPYEAAGQQVVVFQFVRSDGNGRPALSTVAVH